MAFANKLLTNLPCEIRFLWHIDWYELKNSVLYTKSHYLGLSSHVGVVNFDEAIIFSSS